MDCVNHRIWNPSPGRLVGQPIISVVLLIVAVFCCGCQHTSGEFTCAKFKVAFRPPSGYSHMDRKEPTLVAAYRKDERPVQSVIGILVSDLTRVSMPVDQAQFALATIRSAGSKEPEFREINSANVVVGGTEGVSVDFSFRSKRTRKIERTREVVILRGSRMYIFSLMGSEKGVPGEMGTFDSFLKTVRWLP